MEHYGSVVLEMGGVKVRRADGQLSLFDEVKICETEEERTLFGSGGWIGLALLVDMLGQLDWNRKDGKLVCE